MDVLVLGSKTTLAVMLLVAGGAKLADLTGFAAVIRLFVPMRAAAPAYRYIATAVAFAEIILGCASLSFPAVTWINLVVLAVGCAFAAVSVIGFARHRGKSCRCFGALSRRKFDVPGIARSSLIAAFAAVATVGVSPSAVRLGVTAQILLLAAAVLLLAVSFTAAKALAAVPEAQSR
jgi:hypothetical protein